MHFAILVIAGVLILVATAWAISCRQRARAMQASLAKLEKEAAERDARLEYLRNRDRLFFRTPEKRPSSSTRRAAPCSKSTDWRDSFWGTHRQKPFC